MTKARRRSIFLQNLAQSYCGLAIKYVTLFWSFLTSSSSPFHKLSHLLRSTPPLQRDILYGEPLWLVHKKLAKSWTKLKDSSESPPQANFFYRICHSRDFRGVGLRPPMYSDKYLQGGLVHENSIWGGWIPTLPGHKLCWLREDWNFSWGGSNSSPPTVTDHTVCITLCWQRHIMW